MIHDHTIMRTDSRIYEGIAKVEALHLVKGDENTPPLEPVFDVPYLDLDFKGVSLSGDDLDRHHGSTRVVRNYQVGKKWAGRLVRNERQVSLATREDLLLIAEDLFIIQKIIELIGDDDIVRFMAECLAVNVVIHGANIAPYLGPGTKLFIGEPETGAIVDISEAHLPCKKPATALASRLELPIDDIKAGFKAAAAERRGYMASVYSPGRIALGDTIDCQLAIDHRSLRPVWGSS